MVLAVVSVFLILGAATFLDDAPAFGSGGGDGWVPDPLPTAAPTAAPYTAPASTPASVRSEQVALDVAADADGFELTYLGGTRARYVTTIEIAVSDNYGYHAIQWHFPFIGERFFLPVEMYGGSLYGPRYLWCEAVYENGEREAVFAQYYY